jgi:predicted transcriptional regulator
MKEQKAVDSFGSFLKSAKRSAPDASEGASLSLLRVLKDGPLPLKDLIEASGMSFHRFAEALQSMRKLGLVKVTDQAGTEIAELTPDGAQLAKLAHE